MVLSSLDGSGKSSEGIEVDSDPLDLRFLCSQCFRVSRLRPDASGSDRAAQESRPIRLRDTYLVGLKYARLFSSPLTIVFLNITQYC